MKKRIVYIVSGIDKAIAFEWIVDALAQQYDFFFILMNQGVSQLEGFLEKRKIPTERIKYTGKKDFFQSFFKIRKELKKIKPDAVHTHLLDASLVGLLAARSVGISKRIYTRHHAMQHHDYFPRAVYYDKLINFCATHIIAISEQVRNILIQKEGVKKEKIHVVHHGFKMRDFENIDPDRVKKLKEKYLSEDKAPVIGIISRYLHLKGIQYIIPAFKKLLENYPNAHLLLANAKGNYKQEIEALLSGLPSNSYTQIPFEYDLFALYHLFDLYVHVPIYERAEAFGQTYIEALASGIPSIFTLSGVACEFVENNKNAWVVPFKDKEAIYDTMKKIIEEKGSIHQKKIIERGRSDVYEKFDLNNMLQKLITLYDT